MRVLYLHILQFDTMFNAGSASDFFSNFESCDHVSIDTRVSATSVLDLRHQLKLDFKHVLIQLKCNCVLT